MTQLATLAGGCFWCTEAVFRRVPGVVNVQVGYSGGKRSHPTYEQIGAGVSGHVECVQVKFDPHVVTYIKLLEVFMATHDPTSRDRQDYDEGSQYRSVIFYHDEKQRQVAQEMKKSIPRCVTELLPFQGFYPAEIEHQQYYEQNKGSPYCKIIIEPKIQKLIRMQRSH